MRDLPIGFYDSGLGGVSVLKQTYKLLPNENFIYYGDAKNAPYGTKSEKEILALSLKCGEFLFKKKVKMIVIACNTATSIAVSIMRDKYNIPIVSIEPAIKPALATSKNGKVLVLATPATINQSRYNDLLKKYDKNNRVINIECNGLSSLIENYNNTHEEITEYIKTKFSNIDEDISAIVLGCTHYSFISDTINEVAIDTLKGKCKIFDGMFGVAKRVKTILSEMDLTSKNNLGSIDFYSSDNNISVNKYEEFFLKF